MNDNVVTAVVNMFLPLTMLGLGLMIWRTRPGYRDLFGYHTTWAEKSEEAWNFAQELFGRLCTITFAIASFLTLIAGLIPVIAHMDEAWVSIISGIVCFVDLIPLFVIIFIVEGKLKKNFDKDGHRKGSDDDEL